MYIVNMLSHQCYMQIYNFQWSPEHYMSTLQKFTEKYM